ncbi:MAG: THO complex subunit 1 transcription elongation factor-domain-containing protein [Linnemannia gamsii]|nr:MAG: THO complex subunit 1 transcription elongation factor-domain-containing protein [Linnemannia gamsii]
MANTMLRLPPFGPLLNTAGAITRVLAETKDQMDISADSENDKSSKSRFTAFDDIINSIIVPELDKYKTLDRPSLLEGAFKMKLFSIQNELGTTTKDLTNALFRCLDLLMRCADLELVDQLTPMHLIEEVLDLQTVECGEQVYYYLESHVDILASDIASTKGKGLSLLRICNELLRRLSKAKNTVLCGRILMLLSSVFPITERSGVNLKGEFNTENVTLIESDDVVIVPELVSTPSLSQKGDDSRVPVGEAMDVDQETVSLAKDQMEEDKPEEMAKAQSRFYTDFWSLQSFFNNPTQLINAPDHMAKLQEGIDKTLAKFASIEEEEQKSRGQRTESTSATAEASTSESTAESAATQSLEKKKHSLNKDKTSLPSTYFPKFLTSPKLLQLEIVDPYFRKHILVQFLIMVQYLQSHNLTAKEAQARITTPNRQFLSQWILDVKDQEWTEATRPKILKHLKATGVETGDSSFLSTVEEILKDEESWVQWKAGSCHPFEKPSWTTEQVEQTRQKRKRLSQKMAPLKQRLGCASLTGLWREVAEREDEDTEFGSYQPPREVDTYLSGMKFVRNRESMIRKRKVDQTKTPLTLAEEEELKEKEQGRLWRALRLGVRQYIHLYDNLKLDFDGLVKAIKDDEEFEEMVRENGGKVPEPPATEEETAAVDDKVIQAGEDAGAQDQTGDKAKLVESVNGMQEDEDMKEADAVDSVATKNADDVPVAVSTSSTPSPAAAAPMEGATEAHDDKAEPEKTTAPSSPTEKPVADGDIAMEGAPTLNLNSSTA